MLEEPPDIAGLELSRNLKAEEELSICGMNAEDGITRPTRTGQSRSEVEVIASSFHSINTHLHSFASLHHGPHVFYGRKRHFAELGHDLLSSKPGFESVALV